MKNNDEVENTKYLCEKIPELNEYKREKKEKFNIKEFKNDIYEIVKKKNNNECIEKYNSLCENKKSLKKIVVGNKDEQLNESDNESVDELTTENESDDESDESVDELITENESDDESVDELITENESINKTGKNRDLKDQFFTKPDIAEECIKNIQKHIKMSENDLIIEPSAGSGSFSDVLVKEYKNIESYDIEPKKTYITKQNFLELNTENYQNFNKIHVIGNPPFGRQSSLAKNFIKKCCSFSDTISFILPKSFRKMSYQTSFSLNFHLIEEYEIEKNAFTIDNKVHHVPCVFQIWEKKNTNRYVEEEQVEKGFKFIDKPMLETLEVNDKGKPIRKKNVFTENPDFGILRAGGGNKCGRISLNYEDGIKCYPEGWLFIRLNHGYDKDKFYNGYQKIDWMDDSNVGARSISKPIFIKGINELLVSMD